VHQHITPKAYIIKLNNYTHTFILLNQYDTGNFPEGGLSTNITCEIGFHAAMKAIKDLKKNLMHQEQATELFGQPKDESFQGIVDNVVLNFGVVYLYLLSKNRLRMYYI
jgi:GTP cyclohydrolase II